MVWLSLVHFESFIPNNVSVKRVPFHKHLELILDSKLDCNEHFNTALSNVSKMITLLQTFQHVLPCHSLTIQKIFVRPHLDYGSVVYDKVSSETFHENLEPLQYNAAVAITRPVRKNNEKLY